MMPQMPAGFMYRASGVDMAMAKQQEEFEQSRGKAVFGASKDLVVVFTCYMVDTFQNEIECGHCNGFLYGGEVDGMPLLMTSAHMLGWGGATIYKASHLAGLFPLDSYDLDLVKSGDLDIDTENPPIWPCVAHYFPDVAIFKFRKVVQLALPAALPAGLPSIGDKIYIVAYVNGEIHLSDGMITCASLRTFTTDGYSDNGYSGAPIINLRGCLMGVVAGNTGNTNKLIRFVPTTAIEQLLQTGHPSLPGLVTY